MADSRVSNATPGGAGRSSKNDKITIETRITEAEPGPQGASGSGSIFDELKTLRLLLVDDHETFLRIVADYLSSLPQFQVVGLARSGEEALRRVPELAPDLVLMDWTMPGLSGLEAARRLKAQPEAPRVVIVSIHNHPGFRAACLRNGADGYVVKDQFMETALPVIAGLFPDIDVWPTQGG